MCLSMLSELHMQKCFCVGFFVFLFFCTRLLFFFFCMCAVMTRVGYVLSSANCNQHSKHFCQAPHLDQMKSLQWRLKNCAHSVCRFDKNHSLGSYLGFSGMDQITFKTVRQDVPPAYREQRDIYFQMHIEWVFPQVQDKKGTFPLGHTSTLHEGKHNSYV